MKLQTTSNIQTMSSREIAGLTGKQHQHVKRDIEKMIIELQEDVSNFGRIYLDSMNRKQTEYLLDRDHTDCLLTGYSARARMVIIKRWKELENGSSPKLPQTFAEALQLAADQARQLELQAPKVEFVDRYVESTGNKTFREVAKLLQANERTFRAMLISEKIMYNLNGSWVVYSPYDKKGYFHTTTGERNGHAFNTVKFTPKGVTWISDKWNKFNK